MKRIALTAALLALAAPASAHAQPQVAEHFKVRPGLTVERLAHQSAIENATAAITLLANGHRLASSGDDTGCTIHGYGYGVAVVVNACGPVAAVRIAALRTSRVTVLIQRVG